MINRATSQSQSVLRDVLCQDIVVEAQCREPDDGKGASKSAREDGNAEVPSEEARQMRPFLKFELAAQKNMRTGHRGVGYPDEGGAEVDPKHQMTIVRWDTATRGIRAVLAAREAGRGGGEMDRRVQQTRSRVIYGGRR